MKNLNNYITEALVKNHINFDDEFIDLYLPSHTLWCSHNLGASKPEEYGKYYSWGETKEKQFYNGNTYNNISLQTKLTDDQDAAKLYNKKWSMPDYKDIAELLNNTVCDKETINGVNGVKFSSKVNPCKYIFIPFNGYISDKNLSDEGTQGYLWSKDKESKYTTQASILNVFTHNAMTGVLYCPFGCGIRPIIKQ